MSERAPRSKSETHQAFSVAEAKKKLDELYFGLADKIRKSGAEPNDLADWQLAVKERDGLKKALAKFDKTKDPKEEKDLAGFIERGFNRLERSIPTKLGFAAEQHVINGNGKKDKKAEPSLKPQQGSAHRGRTVVGHAKPYYGPTDMAPGARPLMSPLDNLRMRATVATSTAEAQPELTPQPEPPIRASTRASVEAEPLTTEAPVVIAQADQKTEQKKVGAGGDSFEAVGDGPNDYLNPDDFGTSPMSEEGVGDGPNDFLTSEDFGTPRENKEKLKSLIAEIETHTGATGGEKLITLPDEDQMDTPKPPVQELTDAEKYPGGLYDSSRWTGRGAHTPSRNPLPNRPTSEIYPPKWALERAAQKPVLKNEKKVAPKRRGRLGRLAAAAALVAGLTSAPDPSSKRESPRPTARIESQTTKVAPQRVSIERPVPKNVGAPLQNLSVEIKPPETPEGVTVVDVEGSAPLEAPEFAPDLALDASEPTPVPVVETGPPQEVGPHIVPKPLVETSPSPLRVEYGASPESLTNKHGVRIDKMQAALFADEKGVVTAYGGGFDERAELAHTYAESHPGKSVRIEAVSKGQNYVGEYSIDMRGITQIIPVAEREASPGIFAAIGRLFKKKPEIDVEQFVRKLGA